MNGVVKQTKDLQIQVNTNTRKDGTEDSDLITRRQLRDV
jgi:hypothetical protein